MAQTPSFGPLASEEGAPLQRVSYTATSESADLVPPGRIGTDLWLGLSNIFEQDSAATHHLFIDLERLITALTLRVGVHERLEVGGRLTLETTGAGVLDGVIHWWHDRLGFGQANRDRFPEGMYEQRLEAANGTVVLDQPRRALGLDDVRLYVKWRALAASDGRSTLALKLATRLPAHSALSGGEASDLALVALGRLGAGSWYLHGMAGASTVRAWTQPHAHLNRSSAFLMLGVERSIGSGLAALAQWSIASPVMRGFDDRELDRAPSNVVVGLAGRAGEAWRWDVSFQEDVPADTPAIDFTFGVRVSRTHW